MLRQHAFAVTLVGTLQLISNGLSGQTTAQRYNARAQQYRESAVAANNVWRAYYAKMGDYFDCLASQLGPTGPSQCARPAHEPPGHPNDPDVRGYDPASSASDVMLQAREFTLATGALYDAEDATPKAAAIQKLADSLADKFLGPLSAPERSALTDTLRTLAAARAAFLQSLQVTTPEGRHDSRAMVASRLDSLQNDITTQNDVAVPVDSTKWSGLARKHFHEAMLQEERREVVRLQTLLVALSP